jgi:membrane associated rhomboid family serine protease
VVVNAAVFLAWQVAALWSEADPVAGSHALELMARNFLVSTPGIEHGDVWTLLTSAFSHNAFGHLFLNMLALWVFGQDVERVVGPRAFLHLYVAGGILASIGHVLYGVATGSAMPALGASGAVMAVAVVAAYLFPGRMLLLFFVIPLPQFLAVALFLLLDVFGVVAPNGDTVAHAAHLGGALYGWLYWHVSLRPWLLEQLEAAQRRTYGSVWDHPEP